MLRSLLTVMFILWAATLTEDWESRKETQKAPLRLVLSTFFQGKY